MRFRFSFVLLGVLAIPAAAQTGDKRAIMPTPDEMPGPGVVPPSDLDKSRKRTFQITLKNVKASLMAFWLDPANHERPLRLQNGSTPCFPYAIKLDAIRLNDGEPPFGAKQNTPQEGKPDIFSPLPPGYHLPEGVDRVVAVDPQRALLVFGTPSGAAELAATIRLLDRPARAEVTEFEVSVYWLDSLALRDILGQSARPARVATANDWRLLDELKQKDRATFDLFPSQTARQGKGCVFPLSPPGATRLKPPASGVLGIPVPVPPITVQSPYSQTFYVPSPPNELRVTPILIGDNPLVVSGGLSDGPDFPIQVRQGESLILSGTAKELGFAPVSPRFEAFVVRITPHVSPLVPAPSKTK